MVIERIKPPGEEGPFPGTQRGAHLLAHRNWLEAPDVLVSFSVRHDGSNIYLYYFIEEPYLRATCTDFNSSVWEDSCVEFFVSFGEDRNYYNFECNCIGTLLGAYGKDRHKREFLPVGILKDVETNPSLGRKPFGELKGPASWKMLIRIPVETFIHSHIEDLNGQKATGNFYKCGDLLPAPHYLSWREVKSPEPDFHTPQFFGPLIFQ